MSYKFNPFTGNLDEVGTGGAGSTPGGSDGTVQYNEGGVLKGNSDFTVDPDWNDAATVFTGLKLNVTDTASAASSSLLDLQKGGTSMFRVTGGSDASLHIKGTGNSGSIFCGSTAIFSFFDPIAYGPQPIRLNGVGIAFSPNADLQLLRDGPNILAQQNLTNAQTYRLYNTYTDASNYERGFFQWNSNVLEIGSEGAGTGSEQPVRITAATLKLPNLPTYADNTAATSGGLVAGDVYKTATGELRITV